MHSNYLRYCTALVFLLWLAGCSRETLEDIQPTAPGDMLPKEAINEVVEQHLQSTNTVFRWETAGVNLVWSAMAHGDHHAAIGYQPAGFENLPEHIHEIEVTQGEWKAVRDRLARFVVEETNRLLPAQRLTEKDLMVAPEDGVLPILEMKILHPELVVRLRALPEVRYVEPTNYDPEGVNQRSDSGCDVAAAWNIPADDYTTIDPGAKAPWNFAHMRIQQAWNTSRGDNIGICIIDTGTSPNQAKLNGSFATGAYSANRAISRYGTYVSSWWPWASPDGPNDQCGHGTQMAGLVAGPRGTGGASVGVAYQADLVTVRGTGDVVINGSSEKRGVKDGLVIAGNRSDVRIVSMSIGDVFYASTVADGIYYAYNRGKLLFAAAGTSLTWTSWWGVIFPANMAETVAVTGIMDGSPMQRCNTCHSGSEVDFVIVMQRRGDNSRTSLTLAPSGDQPAYVGGSSAATATTAGIAALVWATNPGQSRAQVLNRLKQSAGFYPSRNGEFGWGLINAEYAVSNN